MHLIGGILSIALRSISTNHGPDFGNSLISSVVISVFQPDAGFASSGRTTSNSTER